MRHVLIAAFACLLPAVAFADADAILAEAAKACAEQDNGVFASDGAVRQIDMTGDGTEDTLVDEGLFLRVPERAFAELVAHGQGQVLGGGHGQSGMDGWIGMLIS